MGGDNINKMSSKEIKERFESLKHSHSKFMNSRENTPKNSQPTTPKASKRLRSESKEYNSVLSRDVNLIKSEEEIEREGHDFLAKLLSDYEYSKQIIENKYN